MSFRYVCRCCGMRIAEFDQTDLSEVQLGLDSLTPEEREHIITRDAGGDTVIRITCDYCRDALDRHPELSLIGNPLQ
ncbi:anti-sigma-F factor Fin family protein [Brevibacillus humidisoli]|uniref:anti-sigma-F factor Fin n=1 Tax=Brevibacillus humidisoli TaxID=2895522 RepID=UPI001E648898|nr:anti-sigma-F factor Fin [Brevibacillus humidisoli]UFJ43401.1 anti-sigma-F factor Fin family protein [Brevibacillus humidisoli]